MAIIPYRGNTLRFPAVRGTHVKLNPGRVSFIKFKDADTPVAIVRRDWLGRLVVQRNWVWAIVVQSENLLEIEAENVPGDWHGRVMTLKDDDSTKWRLEFIGDER